MSGLVSAGYGSSSSEDEDEKQRVVDESKKESTKGPKGSHSRLGLSLPAARRSGLEASANKKRKIIIEAPSPGSIPETSVNEPSLPDEEDELSLRGGISTLLPAPKNRRLDEVRTVGEKQSDVGEVNDANDNINTESIAATSSKKQIPPGTARLAGLTNAKPQDMLAATSCGVDASILDKIINRKKKPIMPASSFYPKKPSASVHVAANAKTAPGLERKAPDKTPEISLFPMGPDLSRNISTGEASEEEEYSSLSHTTNLTPASQLVSSDTEEQHQKGPDFNTGPLNEIAQEMGLDEAGLRILQGRRRGDLKSGSTAMPQIIDYSIDQEYQRNEELRASGAFDQEKLPVRSIGGGRHQLSSLLANTTSQLDRLEESFARGRKNKKESGSKYGF